MYISIAMADSEQKIWDAIYELQERVEIMLKVLGPMIDSLDNPGNEVVPVPVPVPETVPIGGDNDGSILERRRAAHKKYGDGSVVMPST